MVYIKAIEKEVFPYFLRPKKNELFTSWLCRLSINHNIKPQSFVLNYFGRNYPIWNRDIDMTPQSSLIHKIVNHTPLKVTEIKNLFLFSYESYAYEMVARNGANTENILPLGINHRKRKRFGLQFCYKCLNNDAYYKKEWRLITSIVCVKCKVFLQDRCQKCQKPISFHRINIGNNLSIMEFKPLKLCSYCDSDLSIQEAKEIPGSLEVEYQKYIDSTIKNGYNELTHYSFTYISTLSLLAKKLRYKSPKNRFRKAIQKEFNENFPATKVEFKFWSTKERISCLPFSYLLLRDMGKLKDVINKQRVSRSYLDQENTLPFWFLNKIYY